MMDEQEEYEQEFRNFQEHLKNYSPKIIDPGFAPQIPMGNIPELKIIELLKDIKTYLIILIGIASIILGTIIGRFVL